MCYIVTVCVKYLYVAPDVLDMMDAPAIGTREGDVYSFGIIMNELALIAGPYSVEMTYLTPEGMRSRWVGCEPRMHEHTHANMCNFAFPKVFSVTCIRYTYLVKQNACAVVRLKITLSTV